VINELRVAGLLKRRTGPSRRRAIGVSASGAQSLKELDGAEPGAQPALLLQLIAARLVAQDRLPPARAFTVRELLKRARLPGAAESGRLAQLATVSEKVRYAADGVTPPVLAAALRGGRELLAALESPAATGAA